MNRDKVGALFFLMFSIAYGILAYKIPLTFISQQESFNARTMPYALGITGALLSFLMLVVPSERSGEDAGLKAAFKGLDWPRVGLLVVMMVFYGLTLRLVGFVISSVLFLVGGFTILGERRWWLIFVGSVPLVLFIWFLMSRILGMYIAPGEIFYMMGIIE